MVYSLQIVDNDSNKGNNIAKDIGQALTGRITIKLLFKVASGNPNNWGLVLLNDFTDINDSSTFNKIIAVVFDSSQVSGIGIYDYSSNGFIASNDVGIEPADGKWHMLVVQLDTSSGELWVSIDGLQVSRVTLSSNYNQLKGVEIDFAGSTGTGELHIDYIEIYNGSQLVTNCNFEDQTTCNFVQLDTSVSGSIGTVQDQSDVQIEAYPYNIIPIPFSDIYSVYIPSINKAYFGAGYTIGGGSTPSNKWYELDLDTGSITEKAQMPVALWGSAVAYDPRTNKIYLFGGSDGSNLSTNYLLIYDIDNDTWSQHTLDVTIKEGAMAVYNPIDNVIHIIWSNNHIIYDINTGNIVSKSSPPTPVTWGHLSFYNKMIWLVVGFDTSSNSSTAKLYVYDPSTDTWTVKTSPPFENNGKYGFVREGVWLNGKLYILYGQDDGSSGKFYATIFEYDPSTDTWTKKGYGLIPRDGPAGFIGKDGFIYVLGGRDNHRNPIDPNDQIDKLNILEQKVIIMSPHSDTYGFVGDTITVIVLDNNNNPIQNTSVTIYKNGNSFTTCETDNNGQCSFTPDSEGTYYAEVS